MKQNHPDFEPTVSRVAQRMARVLLPQHLHTDSDDSTDLDEHLFGAPAATDRTDAALSDVDAINALYAQKD